MKKNCDNCKALEYFGGNLRCTLGYKIELVVYDDILIGASPLEICPKPKTRMEWHDAVWRLDKEQLNKVFKIKSSS